MITLSLNNQEVLGLKELNIDSYLQTAYQYLKDLATSRGLTKLLEIAFGSNYNLQTAQKLFTDFSAGNFSSIPKIDILSNHILDNANGTYSMEKNQIFLNQDFLLQNQDNPEVIVDVLLEEIGNFIDLKINDSDSFGDEGVIFSALVQLISCPSSDKNQNRANLTMVLMTLID